MSSPETGKKNEKKAILRLQSQGLTILNMHPDPRYRDKPRIGGWPDFLAIDADGELHFYEIKGGEHKLDPHQRKLLQALNRCGTVHILHYIDSEFIKEEIFEETL